MRIIEVTVSGSYLTRDSQNAGVQGEANASALRIEFDPGWDGLVKTLTWWNARGEYAARRILTEEETGGRRCLAPIPGEALAEPGKCRFAIDGYIAGKRMRSVYSELMVKPAGGTVAENDPSPTLAEQLQSRIDAMADTLQSLSADRMFTPLREEWEDYADAMAAGVASYFCNLAPGTTDCVKGNPRQTMPFAAVYEDTEAALYTNLLRYDAVIDGVSPFGHYETEDWTPDKDGNHDTVTVGGKAYPVMYMNCSNFLMLLTKGRDYRSSPWYQLFTNPDITVKQLASCCLEKGDTNESPWSFDCLNVSLSWRMAEVLRSSGCIPFRMAEKSAGGSVRWDASAVENLRDGDILFAGNEGEREGRYKGIYHCMMYFRDLERLNAAAKAWGSDVELCGFDEAQGLGFSGKYGYCVHCGVNTDKTARGTRNVLRIETMERFLDNTDNGVTIWGVRAASNAMNSTKLHQGVTGRMMLYDCIVVSSYRHNTDFEKISYNHVESMRTGTQNGIFSYGQYRYSQPSQIVQEGDTLDFNDYVGSKKAGTYSVMADNVLLVNGPTEGNVTEGSSLMANPTVKPFLLEVKCVNIANGYTLQRVSTITRETPKVWERTFNYQGVPSAWREMCDSTRVYAIVEQLVGSDQEEQKERLSALEQQVSDLLYTPIAITSFTHNIGTKERGETVTSVTLSWTLNKEPETLKLDGETLTAAKTGSRTISGLSITAANANSVKWTLSAADERDKAATKQSPGFTFLNCVYYGAAAQPDAIDSGFIKSLATKTAPTATRSGSITVNGGGNYIWYCLPVSLGTCSFMSNGFPFDMMQPERCAFTNALGYTEDYYVYRSTNPIDITMKVEVS